MLLEKVKSDAKADNLYLFFRGGVSTSVFMRCLYVEGVRRFWGTPREKACICKNRDQRHGPRGKGSLQCFNLLPEDTRRPYGES